MAPELKIDLTADEREDREVIGYTFRVIGGAVSVTEHWPSHDEIWNDGVTISVPLRVWNEAMPWVASQIR